MRAAAFEAFLKEMADEFTMNDNYHQPVMGAPVRTASISGLANTPSFSQSLRWTHRRCSI